MSTSFRFAADRGFASLACLRREFSEWLTAADVADREDLVVAINELASNGIEASPTGRVVVDGVRYDGSVCMTVTNVAADTFQWDPTAAPTDVDREGGRGLPIVEALSDFLRVTSKDGRTEALMVKLLA